MHCRSRVCQLKTVTSYRSKIWLLYLFLYRKRLMHVSEDKKNMWQLRLPGMWGGGEVKKVLVKLRVISINISE